MGSAFCENHNFEMADDICGQCGRDYCAECVVYPYGPKKPPLCKSCAIARAGIRKHAAAPPALSKRELRRRRRDRKQHAHDAPPAVVDLHGPPASDALTPRGEPVEPQRSAPAEPVMESASPAMESASLANWTPSFDRGLARLH